MKKALTFSALASLLALQGCMGQSQVLLRCPVVQEMQEQKAEAVEDTVSDLPSWCIELPKSNAAIYSCELAIRRSSTLLACIA